MANDVQHMTKAELIAHIRDLERAADPGELRKAREELRIHQEQVQAHHEQLIEAQRNLAATCDGFMSLYEAAPVAFATLDRNGVIEEINQTGLALLKLERDQVLKRPLLVFIAGADRQLFLNHMSRCRNSDRTCVAELGLSVRGAGPILVQLTSRPATRPRLGGTYYLTAITDLTELRAAEAERQRLVIERQAARAANEAKDHFLAVLSHELRTPLTPVVAALAMLQNDSRFDPETRENLEMIRRNVQLEASLIDDLLDVTRIARGKVELDKQRVELSAIIRRAVEVCMPDIQIRKIEFGINTPNEPCPVKGDPVRLQQVVWNLLKNAIKFTPHGGCIGIRCWRNQENQAIVDVSDSGQGIAPDLLPRLFTAFEQGGKRTTRQFGGLGLGLAISKAITELHGGTLTACSEGLGKGATFTLKLPLLPAGVAHPTAPTPPVSTGQQPPAPARPLRILLVEDHGDTARIMKKLLSADGHKVEIAGDIATAMDLARERTFDLMLSDLGLPDGSGLDLMRAIRAQGLKLPSIALSGYGQEIDIQQSRKAGFAAHLTKPVNLPKLKEAITHAAQSPPDQPMPSQRG